jgi:large subunit ribosomal protein L6
MSRVAKNPVIVPANVEVTITAEEITVKGPLGTLKQKQSANVSVVKDGNQVQCAAVDGSIPANAMSGTMRALLANMVQGVSQGFERKLTLVGVGYRAQAKGDTLGLTLGFSHPVEHKMPAGVKVETPSQTEIVLKGADKQQVGQVAAEIRAYRRPEPYKGKGVRYADEVVNLKETKKK